MHRHFPDCSVRRLMLLSTEARIGKQKGRRALSLRTETRSAPFIPPLISMRIQLRSCTSTVLEEDGQKIAFVRGAFLAGGSVSDPEKSYHLELSTTHASVSREAYSILLDMGFSPKETKRSGSSMLYFKQSETIADFCTWIGAPVTALKILNAKVDKDMRNAINRKVNCDSANADKIVLAAQEQLNAIKEIDRVFGLENLPTSLHEAALLRIANPAASISDLAKLSLPPVSKSTLNYRLNKLMALQKKLLETGSDAETEEGI